MKSLFLLAAATLAALSSADRATAALMFDIDSTTANPGVNLGGWTSVVDGTGTDGTVSVLITGFAGGRDRGTAATMQGADNGDIQVPAGTFGDLYRDIIFTGVGDSIDVSFTGLDPMTDYVVEAWTYDSGATGTGSTEQEFFVGGNVVASVLSEGDQGSTGPDPDTNALTDYVGVFTITTDGVGAASFSTSRAASQGARLNGIRLTVAIPEPSSFGVLSLGALAIAGLRRRV